MASKISWFNKTLYKKNLTGCWPLWAAASLLACLVPLSVWAGFGSVSKNAVISVLTLVSAGNPFFVNIYGLVAAAVTWRFLHKPRRTQMMHSLPVTRTGIYVTGVASALTVIVIPYAVACLILILLSIRSGIPVVALLQCAAIMLAEILVCVSIATFCAMITGSTVMMIILFYVFNYLAVFTDSLIGSYSEGFLFGISGRSFDGLEFLSPMIFISDTVRMERGYGDITYMNNGWILAVYSAAAILLLAVCLLIYRKRSSESAGETISVRALRPVFLCGVTVYSALTLGRIFYAIMFGLFYGTQYYMMLPIICCVAAGGVIGFLAASMLLKRSFRVFDRKHLIGIAVTVVGCAAFCVCLHADLGGRERFVPDNGQIKRLYVDISADDQRGMYLVQSDETELLDQLKALHGEIISEKDELMNRQPGANTSFFNYDTIYYRYTLSSGELVERRYYIAGTTDALRSHIEGLREGSAGIRSLHLDSDGFELESAEIVSDSDGVETLTSLQASELLAAMRADAEAGALPLRNFNWDEVMLEFVCKDPDARPDGASLYDSVSLAITPEMTNTREYLRSVGYDSFRVN